jgi:hypothetical protein
MGSEYMSEIKLAQEKEKQVTFRQLCLGRKNKMGRVYKLMCTSRTNKMQRYTMILITINALHVSGGSSAHRQELKTVYTASGIC